MKEFFKTLLGLMVYFGTFGLLLAAVVFWWGTHEFTKLGTHTQAVEILVERGTTIGGVSDQLLYNKAIQHPVVFNIAGRITGQASKIKAGEYEIPALASMKEILQILEEGKTIQRNVTIPEGLTVFEITNILGTTPNLQQKPVETLPSEGALLPETYSFTKIESNLDVLERMKSAMKKVIDESWEKRMPGLPFASKEEALTMASIVEKETGKPEERARIAGVFINRLKQNMPLQTDPTVIYALTQGRPQNDGQGPLGRRLLKTDLDIDSPYNTYKYPGLPPTPIANPGKAAIEATLNPEQHEYLYFVADGTGGHAFAKTLDEHNANVAKWRVIRREKEN